MSSTAQSLQDYQQRIASLVIDRGFDKESVSEVFTLLIEEVGELAKAIRKFNGQKIDGNSEQFEVAEEMADVFWLVLDLSNRLGIDLQAAFEQKEAKNQTRIWK